MIIQDYLWFSLAVFAIILIVIIILVIKSKKQEVQTYTVNEEFIDNLIKNLGGKDNIKAVDVELRRVKIILDDIENANFDEIKAQGASGAFISGNSVKVMFEQDPEEIVGSLKNKCGL